MDLLLILGLILVFAAAALWVSRDYVTRHVTSKSLGSLAPGFAATRSGYFIYTGLVTDIGLILIALHFSNAWLLLAAIVLFVVESIAAIAGEVVVYRGLKR
ncbi:MAG TPA: hypothetical protein VI384_06610 [Candidatus Dormibacteraeota bacterium]